MAERLELNESYNQKYLQELLRNLAALRNPNKRELFLGEIASQIRIAKETSIKIDISNLNDYQSSSLMWLPTDIRSIMEGPSWKLEWGGTNINILGVDGEPLQTEIIAPITNAKEALGNYARQLSVRISKDSVEEGATIKVTLDYAFPTVAIEYQEGKYADGHSTIEESKGHDMRAILQSEIGIPLGQYFASLLQKELATYQITNPVQVQVANDTIISLAKAYRGDESKNTRLYQVCGTGFNIGAVITNIDGSTQLINTEAGGYSGHLSQFACKL